MKKVATAFILSALLIAVGIPGIGTTYSFLTDSDSAMNPATPGCNETKIIEDFPDPGPKNPEDNPVYHKTVRITAPVLEGRNVDCYVRARILYSNSELGGAVVLRGQDSAWVKAADGYYYYTRLLREGQTTAPLFTEAALDSSRVAENAAKYVEDFHISIYEESVQAGNHANYRDAWNSFIPGTV